MKANRTRKQGQTMVEYIIIIALIAIALIGVFSYFARGTGKTVVNATKALDSESGSSAESEMPQGGKDSVQRFNDQN